MKKKKKPYQVKEIYNKIYSRFLSEIMNEYEKSDQITRKIKFIDFEYYEPADTIYKGAE